MYYFSWPSLCSNMKAFLYYGINFIWTHGLHCIANKKCSSSSSRLTLLFNIRVYLALMLSRHFVCSTPVIRNDTSLVTHPVTLYWYYTGFTSHAVLLMLNIRQLNVVPGNQYLPVKFQLFPQVDIINHIVFFKNWTSV